MILNFTAPRYTFLFLYSEIYIVHIINCKWSRSVIFPLHMFCMQCKHVFFLQLPRWGLSLSLLPSKPVSLKFSSLHLQGISRLWTHQKIKECWLLHHLQDVHERRICQHFSIPASLTSGNRSMRFENHIYGGRKISSIGAQPWNML